MQPDPRTLEPDICHHIKIGPTGIEWVCISPKHNGTYHHYVNRWPNREK
jgi:hypothetical protein